jgi:hypothetical protein
MIFSVILLWSAMANAIPTRQSGIHLTVPEFTNIFAL